jgi:hypothetical protein
VQEKSQKKLRFGRYFRSFGLSFQRQKKNDGFTENFFKKVCLVLKNDLTLLHKLKNYNEIYNLCTHLIATSPDNGNSTQPKRQQSVAAVTPSDGIGQQQR